MSDDPWQKIANLTRKSIEDRAQQRATIVETKTVREPTPQEVLHNRLRYQHRAYFQSKGDRYKISFKYLCEIWSDKCPCCGLIQTLDRHKANKDSWATLDRKDNLNRDYTEGNVFWICYRCNQIKSNASIETIEGILRYMRSDPGAWRGA